MKITSPCAGTHTPHFLGRAPAIALLLLGISKQFSHGGV